MDGAACLPNGRLSLYPQLSYALSRISCGPVAGSADLELRGVAPLSQQQRGHHGLLADARAGLEGAWLQPPHAMVAGRQRGSVLPQRRAAVYVSEAGVFVCGPPRGGKKYREFSGARSAWFEGRRWRRTVARTPEGAISRGVFSRCADR